MSDETQTDEAAAPLDQADRDRIEAVLRFWFKEHQLSAPQIDGRMDVWFGEDPIFDEQIVREFSGDVDKACNGELDHWADDPRGRLALIILIDQFRRNIYRNQPQAFSHDKLALKLCVEGAMQEKDKGLSAIERVFFYMPLQHAESRRVQEKSRQIFNKLAEAVSPTFRETFETVAQFADLHADIVELYGRFPHRNRVLGRPNTPEEEEYLSGGAPTFGQGNA
jgi:uncharacterized protein (DUF924 family)